jgi:hypothetical protein
LPVSFISCAFERADNLGAYRIPPETGLLPRKQLREAVG